MTRTVPRALALLMATAIPITGFAAVGRTVTSFDVSNTGTATYSIPLFTPPGTAGMTPQLALVYSHHSDNTLLGVGWNISGLSSISRCLRTWAQDGAAGGVRNDLSDRFCLDGNKLRLVSGTYGVASSVYQTEIETFSRITASGAAGNGPASFTVERKDGLIYEYGTTASSRIESLGQSTAREWAVSKIRDRAGNAIDFTYTEDATNGSYRIDSIQYTSNASQGLSSAYAVTFTYETKPSNEIDSRYLAGSLIKEITRLVRIDVTHSGTQVRRYELAYEAALSAASKSRLASVRECAGPSLDCLPHTTFAYQNGTVGLATEVSTGTSIPGGAPLALDLNGDGRTDYVYSSHASSGSGTWMSKLANASGGFDAAVNSGIANTNHIQAIPIDYNADGRGDFMVPLSGGTWWVVQGTATGLAAAVNTSIPATGAGGNARAMDVDGDGLDDLVFANIVGGGNDSVQVRYRVWGSTFSAASFLVSPVGFNRAIIGPVFGGNSFANRRGYPDFNGDGRKDFIVRRSQIDPEEGTTTYEVRTVLGGEAAPARPRMSTSRATWCIRT